MSVKQSPLTSAAIILLLALSPAMAAKQGTVQAVIPWEAEGQVFPVDSNELLFLGAMKGIMYVETSEGEFHEALVVCPIMQEINLETGVTVARGRCEVTASPDDVFYADLNCEGRVGECKGTFTVKSGEGRFAGISGSGKLRVRSPMHALISDLASGETIRVGAGLAIIDDLKFSIP